MPWVKIVKQHVPVLDAASNQIRSDKIEDHRVLVWKAFADDGGEVNPNDNTLRKMVMEIDLDAKVPGTEHDVSVFDPVSGQWKVVGRDRVPTPVSYYPSSVALEPGNATRTPNDKETGFERGDKTWYFRHSPELRKEIRRIKTQ